MNSLSWFLYLAEMIPNVAGFLFIGGIATLGFYIIWSSIVSGYTSWSSETEDQKAAKKARSKTAWKVWPFAVVVIMMLVSMLLPSKQTIYLIAGSEAGEYVVTSPEGAEIINDIKAIIKSQIEELK